MKLSAQLELLASDAVAAPYGAATRSVAANFRWEPAVSSARVDEYDGYIGDVPDQGRWRAEHTSYVRSCVHVAKDLPRSPESFNALNSQAHLNQKLDNAYLLRLESMERLSRNPMTSDLFDRFWLRFINSSKDLLKSKLSDPDEQLRMEFTAQLNAQRTQARPLFATFLNAFGGDLNALVRSDWQHILRDRLGLAHLTSVAGNALPVALMCYTVQDVENARLAALKKGAVASFARPTVLDAEMSAVFVPAPVLPVGQSYGYTLDLANTGIPDPDDFAPELLNFPIEYEASHIKAIGLITRPHALEADEAMLDARNRHVQGLRQLSDCGNFGEVLV